MYGVAGENSPICVESDAFLYNLGDPTVCVCVLFANRQTPSRFSVCLRRMAWRGGIRQSSGPTRKLSPPLIHLRAQRSYNT
jgi:hypothetical protein